MGSDPIGSAWESDDVVLTKSIFQNSFKGRERGELEDTNIQSDGFLILYL